MLVRKEVGGPGSVMEWCAAAQHWLVLKSSNIVYLRSGFMFLVAVHLNTHIIHIMSCWSNWDLITCPFSLTENLRSNGLEVRDPCHLSEESYFLKKYERMKNMADSTQPLPCPSTKSNKFFLWPPKKRMSEQGKLKCKICMIRYVNQISVIWEFQNKRMTKPFYAKLF